MTSRERVLAAFAHEEPDRVPSWCGSSAEFWEKAKRELDLDGEGLRVRFGDDFRRVKAGYSGPVPDLPEDVNSRTVFGVDRSGMGYGQPVTHPLADATLEAIHAYPWPDPAWTDVSRVRTDAEGWRGEYAILGGDWSPYWHDAIDLLGMANICTKMFTEPEVVEAVLGHIVDYYAGTSRKIFDAAADAIDIFFIGNDFGSQTGPLVSPAMFESFLLPHLKRLVDLGHDYGLKVQLHCCGGFAPFVPMMIDAGLDGLHAVQPSCAGMDLATLKEEFGDRVLFNGGIDSHHALIKGTPESVREEIRRVLETMMPGGGFVAGASHDSILEETPVENVVAMFDSIREFGGY
ncbi:MAG: uroporphyrinogen decarboxylase family protein [Planctomycetota bacterium]|jgi:uroporphyrinogen decarboxylase